MTAGAGSVRAAYEQRVGAGAIERDAAQLAAVDRLDALVAALSTRGDLRPKRSSFLSRLLGDAGQAAPTPKGLYIFGEVGRGKTMLMDLFYEVLPLPSKKRVHFHAFMADVHERIHAWRQKLKAGSVTGDDPIKPVAAALAEEASVLCFDEFAVIDIADAMILGRLFTALFEQGVVVVATSNVPPDGLYKNGLNRALFLPFIRLLEEKAELLNLASRTDYRLEKVGDSPVYFTPLTQGAAESMDRLFAALAAGARSDTTTSVAVGTRTIAVPMRAGAIARFDFGDLCSQPLGARDYLAIATEFHTVFIDEIPVLVAERRNEARRFILLIDVLYERHVRLVATAEAAPDHLYKGETGAETFEFARTASRLHEMNSREYWAAARPNDPSGNTAGLVDT